jgi:hypothetical protein
MANQLVLGYDPGGNDAHGVAAIIVSDITTQEWCGTAETVEAALAWIDNVERRTGAIATALGVDTITCWSTGPSGWRPADRFLRKTYPAVSNSVAAPNSLRGSMGLNGMALMIELRKTHPAVVISETHPKVLYYALTAGKRYAFDSDRDEMLDVVQRWLAPASGDPPRNDHEWDALASAYAASMGISGAWREDLHALATNSRERLVMPSGRTPYYWPTP